MNVKACNLVELMAATVDETVLDIARKMEAKKVRQVTILKGGKPVGIVSAVDIINKVVAAGNDPKKLKAKDIMTSPVYFCSADDAALKTFYDMSKKNILSCPVVENGRVIGTLTVQNVMAAVCKKGTESCK